MLIVLLTPTKNPPDVGLTPLKPPRPVGVQALPFTRHPKVFAPVAVAVGNLSFSFLQLVISSKAIDTAIKICRIKGA